MIQTGFFVPVAVFVAVFTIQAKHLEKKKNPRTVVALGFRLELLGRFELPTSSLPNILHLFSSVVSCCNLLFFLLLLQWFPGFTC